MKLRRLALYVFATLNLFLSIAWFARQPAFEPAIAILAQIATLVALPFTNDSSDSRPPALLAGGWMQATSGIIQPARERRSEILSELDVGPDAPVYERLGNIAMHAFGHIKKDSVAAVLQVGVLLGLGGLWASGMAICGQDLQPRALVGLVWLGLVALPPIAGSLPQQQETDLYRERSLKRPQRLLLWLNKAVGVYASSFLGEIAAVLVWLLLVYLDLWSRLSSAIKIVYWSLAVLLTCFLGFVGSVISVRYFWNVTESESAPEPKWQDFLLGFGFPLIIYPGLIVLVWDTIELWERWQFGVPVISVMALILAWLIRRETRHSKLNKGEQPNGP